MSVDLNMDTNVPNAFRLKALMEENGPREEMSEMTTFHNSVTAVCNVK